MFAYAAIPLTCWLAAVIATPRRPRLGNDVEELVYARLLGRQQILRFVALIATMALFLFFVATLPARVDPGLRDVRGAREACANQRIGSRTCSVLGPGGVWVQQAEQGDGRWTAVGTVAAPVTFAVPSGVRIP